MEWVIGSDNQEQAAIEDGTCTLDRVEQDYCNPAGFYVRKTASSLTLPFVEKPLIKVMARNGALGFKVHEDGKIFQEEMSLSEFGQYLVGNDLSITPFIITTLGGRILSVEEQYLP